MFGNSPSKIKKAMISASLIFSLIAPTACNDAPSLAKATEPGRVVVELQTPDARAKNVLVVINNASPDSREIGAYYRIKRQIPKENVVFVNVSRTEEVGKAEFETNILKPIKEKISSLKTRIDFIVTTKGLPLRLDNKNGFSVDGHLATMNMNLAPIKELTETDIRRCISPYFEKDDYFNSKTYNMYLVTRLTGYTKEDAMKLVDNSLAATNKKGPFFFDEASNRGSGGYQVMQSYLGQANDILTKKGFNSSIDKEKKFVAPNEALMGYCSWGSNDGAFDANAYKSLKFLPGALVETYVSTSGRTFNKTSGGQSLIADLITNGVTGVKGYVSEPYTFALARPNILFDRYTSGFNLAESFYMASPVIKWKDVVVGDPLCNPYYAE